ncbi:hypothetical protein, variant [Verruconis gallopava]|uniref:Uncharacterized protein n=1 Tax=Verruconis gallopava TaxID=253628 RepID=A0A0D1Z3M1_9PEZI|nr:hypothetical protein, variant [Verruconis gallopava]KIW07537.1 hypothetical protein, variant [Verruconis gallopava]
MSDIMSSGGRAANGGGARAQVITPIDILRRREERTKAQQERAQASNEESRRRLKEEWERYDSQSAGVAAPPPVQPSSASQAASSATHRRTRSDAVPLSTRAPQTQPGASASANPQSTSQSAQPTSYPSPSAAAQASSNVPASAQPTAPSSGTATRPRASSARQPRPTQASAGPSGTSRPQPAAQSQRPTEAASQTAQAPLQESEAIRAERARLAREAGVAPGTSSEAQGRRSDGTISSFPHAFERWEMLSSKWEGMTSHWISRLQMNSEELQKQPMLAQLSRQVTDLSAAGANLFTALVELQRLRASSERKFQRWFHDTRNEMERQQELVGRMERALIQERRDRAEDQVKWEKLFENARRTEMNSARMNAEKDRELQIAKDESRRAWEELGRYEALERERQKALAQGMPVEIGGYTVYPRPFLDSRQGSVSHRPGAHDDPRPTSRRGPQASQTVQDDPFVADVGAGDAMGQSSARTWSPTRSTAGSHAQDYTQTYSTAAYTTADGGYTSFSSPPGGSPPAGFYSQANTHLGNDPSDDDQLYERDERGNILRDEFGRPISYHRGLHETRSSDSENDNAQYSSFGHDLADRRRVPGTNGHVASAAQAAAGAGAPSMQTRPEADYRFFNEDDVTDDPGSRFAEASHAHEDSAHYHPTRLSDVPEEDELSRASEAGASRGGVPGTF